MSKFNPYTEEEIEWIKENVKDSDCTWRELSGLHYKEFGTRRTWRALASHAHRLGVKKKQRKLFEEIYTEEQLNWLRGNVEGTPLKELCKDFNKNFGLELSFKTFQSVAKRYEIRNGVNKRFKKGKKPTIKYDVGEERIRKDGRVDIKIAQPDIWIDKKTYIWEKAYGKVPKGYVLLQLNQKNGDVTLDQLRLIKRKDLINLNRQRLLSEDEDLNKTALNLVKLQSKVIEIEKESSKSS